MRSSLFTHYIKNCTLGALNRDGVEVMDIWCMDIWYMDILLWIYDNKYMVIDLCIVALA